MREVVSINVRILGALRIARSVGAVTAHFVAVILAIATIVLTIAILIFAALTVLVIVLISEWALLPAAGFVFAIVVWLLIRYLNRRDDPHRLMHYFDDL